MPGLDQAHGLREILRDREGKYFAGSPAPVLVVSEARLGDGLEDFGERYRSFCREENLRSIHISGRWERGETDRGADRLPFRMLERTRFDREIGLAGASTILLEAPRPIGESRFRCYHDGVRAALIATPAESSLLEAYAQLRLLAKNAAVKKMDIIVYDAVDDREAVRAFMQLRDVSERFLSMDLSLAGCVSRAEKNSDSGYIMKSLLSYFKRTIAFGPNRSRGER